MPPHQPHAMDLAPSGLIFLQISGKTSKDEMIAGTNSYFGDIGNFHLEGVGKLEKCRTKCTELKGDYFYSKSHGGIEPHSSKNS